MASLDSLPADQRAVLELVLQRGRSYDEIGQMLSIDRAGVRQRALAAFDVLGPQTRISPERRGLITDYLLGQLPARVSDDMRDRLARTPTERAWARVLASELAPFARDPLPEIPVEAPAGGAVESPVAVPAAAQPGPSAPGEPTQGEQRPAQRPGAEPRRPSSRVGGAVLLGLGAVVALAVVIVVVLAGGSDKKHAATSGTTATSTSAPASTTTAATGTTSTAPATTSTTPGHVVAQINLRPPSGGSAIGVAQVVRVGNVNGVVIVATGIAANTKKDAYAVWLSNSPTDSLRVGFVNPPVTTNGRLQTAGPLPSNAAKFKQLLLTLETQQRPTAPGKVVLQGALKLQ